MQPRRRHPQDRYALANGDRLTRGGRPLFFKPTDLGQYLLYTADRRFVSPRGLPDQPADDTRTARRSGRRLTFRSGGSTLRDHGQTAFRPTRTHGCTAYPEAQIDVKRHMIFDPDHMSVKARKTSLDLIDSLGYSGVVSSHSWSTPDAYPRIYHEKGFIAPYAGDSTGFVEKWKRHLTWANPKTYWGFGFGADINGLGAQGDPRPNAATNNPVTYPFTTLGGVHGRPAGQRPAGLRHQQGRCRALRPLPGLDPGPEDAGRHRHRQGHVARPRGLPADVGAGVDAHYGAATTWDYYKNVHGRNGIRNDGVGAPTTASTTATATSTPSGTTAASA